MLIEVFGDVICPWCYIGKRRIAAAVAQLTDADASRVRIVWRGFELAPDADRVPGPTAAEAMRGWWGEQTPERIALITSNGVQEGLDLDLHLARPVNTFDAHRLLHFAAERGSADETLERVLLGYHTQGRDIADRDVLERLGAEAGLDPADVGAALRGDAYAEAVRADRRRGAALGVTGVPSVVIDGRAPVSGIQPPARLRALIEDALSAPRRT